MPSHHGAVCCTAEAPSHSHEHGNTAGIRATKTCAAMDSAATQSERGSSAVESSTAVHTAGHAAGGHRCGASVGSSTAAAAAAGRASPSNVSRQHVNFHPDACNITSSEQACCVDGAEAGQLC